MNICQCQLVKVKINMAIFNTKYKLELNSSFLLAKEALISLSDYQDIPNMQNF